MRKSKYTKELLEPIVKESKTLSQVLRQLGLKNTGGNYRHIQGRIRLNNIDTNHFTGQSWAKGQTAATSEAVAKSAKRSRYTNEQVFCQNSPVVGGCKLKDRLLKLGWEQKCTIPECGLTNWLGNDIVLHIDHINGIANDNRFENLRFICPNCHQQTKTWGNKVYQGD